jgi:Zn ribbon nucleic-acid-binding protein
VPGTRTQETPVTRLHYIVGVMRCTCCHRNQTAAWLVDADAYAQECQHCGLMAAVPVLARALTDWPEQAANVTMRDIRYAQLDEAAARRGAES